jgi:peptidyl-prolyl cis-trans isomerase D
VIDAALRADAAKLPVLVGVDLGAQGYAVVRVLKVVPRTPPTPELAQQENAQVGQSVAAAEDAAYYTMLKDRFKAEILVPKPADTLPGVAGR